jgi:hypothetical protein
MNLDELSQKQVAIINVGMSTARGLPGPLFQDGSFRFVPIRESKPGKNTPTYRDLGLVDWVPDPDDYAHYDPEFETMTFGDYKGQLRTANIEKLKPRDFLFFFASLSNRADRRRRRTTGLFLIGYFEIGQIFSDDAARMLSSLQNNAHLRRSKDTDFTVWKGTSKSKLLERAVPIDRESVKLYLRTTKGEKRPWNSRDRSGRMRTDLEVINSATRASRLILPKYRKVFWKLVKLKNPGLPIFQQ